jgi:hypothetical protein
MIDQELQKRLIPFKFWPSAQEKEWKETRPSAFGYRHDGHYRSSRAWLNLRVRIHQQRGSVCEGCGKPLRIGRGAMFHHITYRNLCAELDSDIAMLCTSCHGKCHIIGLMIGGDQLRRLLALCAETGNSRDDLSGMLDRLISFAQTNPAHFRID